VHTQESEDGMGLGQAPDAAAAPGTVPVKSRRASWAFVAVVAAVCLGAGMLFGYSLAQSDVRDARAEATEARENLDLLAEAHETLHQRNWILYEEATAAQAEVAAQPSDLPPGTYGDGVYGVGTDIEPGTYRGEVTGEWGYWARLSNTSGMISGILSNAVVRGPFELTVLSSDTAVELRGVTLTAEVD